MEEPKSADEKAREAANWGDCKGPHCRFRAARCQWDFCQGCCVKIHYRLEGSHDHVQPWKNIEAGARPYIGFKVRHSGARAIALPAGDPIALPVPAKDPVPQPNELEELKDDDMRVIDDGKFYCA